MNWSWTTASGENGPEVTEVGFDCMGLTSNYGETDDDSAIRTVNRAIDLGVTHFDTADAYGWGDNEMIWTRKDAENIMGEITRQEVAVRRSTR
jgi:aryl-alcohol dehydrogenase-like predicted oxidoreductase